MQKREALFVLCPIMLWALGFESEIGAFKIILCAVMVIFILKDSTYVDFLRVCVTSVFQTKIHKHKKLSITTNVYSIELEDLITINSLLPTCTY